MMDVIQAGVSGSLGFARKGMQNLGAAAKGVSKLDKASKHSSSSTTNNVPAFMTKSHNPKAAIFARTTQDDLGISTRTKLFGTDQVGQSFAGRALRIEAIPVGSKLEYLAPGRVKFDGVEFRAVRDLGHLSEEYLWKMYRKGVNPVDIHGVRLDGHHIGQKYHREPGAFIVEIPEPAHCISNSIQHPLGTTGGLSVVERADWKKLRMALDKERAKSELMNRGLFE
jgi:hypothetical protein